MEPWLNICILGHVSHGKSTLIKAISGISTQKHSKEKERGCTLKLGYANSKIYQLLDTITTKVSEIDLNSPLLKTTNISFVDCPGHEMLMRVSLSGTSVVDAMILIISANEVCPQPQTLEHFIALDAVMKQKTFPNIIIVQNKIDLVTKERAFENLNEIKELIEGSVAENAPIIPISAQFGLNIDQVLKQLVLFKSQPVKCTDKFRMNILRSFDINKPGTDIKTINGGVIGGSIQSGQLNPGDTIYISPGHDNPLQTKVVSIFSEKTELSTASYGGLISLQTTLDPNLTINDRLVGNLISKEPIPMFDKLYLNCKWLRSVKVKIEGGTELVLNIHSVTVLANIVNKVNRSNIEVKLERTIACDYTDLVFISMAVKSKQSLCGVAHIVSDNYQVSKTVCAQNVPIIEFDYQQLVEHILVKVTKENLLRLPLIQLERHHTKILFSNFTIICNKLNTDPNHLMGFLSIEFGLPASCFSITAEGKLKIRKLVKKDQLENLLKSYTKQYMVCKACKNLTTKMEDKQIICNKCGYIRII